jgi:hypothetical protein
MLQCFEIIKSNSLTVRSIVNLISSALIVGDVHTCLVAHAFGVVVEVSSLAEVWAEDPPE